MKEQTEFKIAEPVDAVETYEFEPIQGEPMLRWKGKRPFESTQFFPAQIKETHGKEVDDWRNKIYWGDNLQVMSHLLKSFRGQINLIYIDPPFDSKADYKKKIELRGKTVKNDRTAFEEKQYTDIWTNDEYLQFMYERLIMMRELLADNGSIYLHCDWHKSHYLRCILDEIFGAAKFNNEIIWCYKSGGAGGSGFSKKHDTIYSYSKTEESIFNQTKQKSYVLPSGNKNVTYYEDEKGTYTLVKVKDWWDDIGMISTAPGAGRVGYPTQKPEDLLERVIKSSSNPGDLIFDCFMGSGTTQAVAMKLGRRFIGADINLGAIETSSKRLLNVASEIQENLAQKKIDIQDEDTENPQTFYTGFEIYNVNRYDIFRNPVEAKDLLIEALEIRPLSASALYDGEKDGRKVKIMPVDRIATRADLNELITGFDYRTFDRLHAENPRRPVEKLLLVCMGHEPGLRAELKKELHPYELDIEVTDILRDKSELEFKREAEAKIVRNNGKLIIEKFYPMNLLQKLSLMKENVEDWRELVESVKIDFNYDDNAMKPSVVDSPEGNQLVKGDYSIPEDAGTIRVKITDLLSESLEETLQ